MGAGNGQRQFKGVDGVEPKPLAEQLLGGHDGGWRLLEVEGGHDQGGKRLFGGRLGGRCGSGDSGGLQVYHGEGKYIAAAAQGAKNKVQSPRCKEWRTDVGARVQVGAGCMAVAAPMAGHVAVAAGGRYGVALALAAMQALAAGLILWGATPRRWRWLGVAVPGVLLAGMAVGAAGWSAEAGVLAGAGLGHAMLYGGLLAVFGQSLRPGRDSLVTQVARRMNPRFHPGMVPYTRGVAWLWCALFAGQLAASAVLLAGAPGAWRGLVTGWHAVAVAAVAVTEVLVRRWRWRHEQPTGFAEMVHGMRAVRRDAKGG